jgi:hypothetical protein
VPSRQVACVLYRTAPWLCRGALFVLTVRESIRRNNLHKQWIANLQNLNNEESDEEMLISLSPNSMLCVIFNVTPISSLEHGHFQMLRSRARNPSGTEDSW